MTAIDLIDIAIERAKEKAKQQNLRVDFQVKDFFTLTDWNKKFASVIDSGLFHVFATDQVRQPLYLKILGHLLEPGGRLYLLATNDLVQLTLEKFKGIFTDGWEIARFTNSLLKCRQLPPKNIPTTAGIPGSRSSEKRSEINPAPIKEHENHRF